MTQGDPLAMHMYALSTRKVIDTLDRETNNVTQVWQTIVLAVGSLAMCIGGGHS